MRLLWTPKRRKMLQDIEVAAMVQRMKDVGQTLSRETLRKVVSEYIRLYAPPIKKDPRQSYKDGYGKYWFTDEDSDLILKRIASEAVDKATKGGKG